MRKQIHQFFRKHRILTLKQLQALFNRRSQRSIFRDLVAAGYLSSYSHTGKYYTLLAILQFDPNGLWHYNEIGFSKFGTLKNTITALVNRALAGLTHNELKDVLHVRVHNSLFELVQAKKISREKVNNLYVYFNSKQEILQQQHQKRSQSKIFTTQTSTLPSAEIRIDLFIEIIRVSQPQVDADKLQLRLNKRGVEISNNEVEQVLSFYNLKKNRVRTNQSNGSAH